jgi:DNA (cytosine-5)-methyltransferase 1
VRYGSVCSGIEAATVAWHPLGWKPAWFAEVAAFPSAVLAHRYPNVPNLGDLNGLLTNPPPAVDVLIGGTPCQSFSVAGLRGGLTDARGNLALAFMALGGLLRPRWIVWENVPGVLSSNGGRDFGSILGALGELGYGYAYRVLDAQYFGLAQRRKRVFVVGHLGNWRRASAVLFEPDRLRRDSPPSRKARAGVAGGAAGGVGARREDGDGEGGEACVPADDRWPASVSPTLTADFAKYQGINNQHLDSQHGGMFVPAVGACLEATRGQRNNPAHETFITHTLRGTGHDASEDGTGRGVPLVPVAFAHQTGGDMRLGWNPESGTSPALQRSQTMAVAYQCHGSNVGEMGTLRQGSGSVTGGVPFVIQDARQMDKRQNGKGWSDEGVAYTLDNANTQAVAPIPFDTTPAIAFSMKDHGADAGPLSPTLRAGGHTNSHANGGVYPGIASPTHGVRRLTPMEMERLQGFPDRYTEIPGRNRPASQCPDGPRAKALGNSMATTCIRWIGENIQRVDNLTETNE